MTSKANNPIKTVGYTIFSTSKTLPTIFGLCRYCGVLGISVDTKVQKSRLILKNDVSKPCRYSVGIRQGIGEGMGKVW